MARLELIDCKPFACEVVNGVAMWVDGPGNAVNGLPQIVWQDNTTWAEANLWAFERMQSVDASTVRRAMRRVLSYSNWLELEKVDWWHFPEKAKHRCLNRYRGALVKAGKNGEISSSEASARMATIIQLYRWMRAKGLLSTEWPLWVDRNVSIRLIDEFGLGQALTVASTNLSISNRKIAGAIDLEDGVEPVASGAVRDIVDYAEKEAPMELSLMLRIGFGTGLRLGSILDLKLATIAAASTDPVVGWFRLSVGPAAQPPVATKFGNSGYVPIALELDSLLVSPWRYRRVSTHDLE